MDRLDIEAHGTEGKPPRKRPWGWFSVNVAANLGQFALNTVVGLFFIPYLVRHLGPAAYGLIPLTFQVTSYLKVLTDALNAAVGRFLTIALERDDDAEANRVFNTSLAGNLLLVAVLLPPGLWVTTRAAQIFNVPSGLERQTSLLFACTVVTFLVLTLANSFQVSSYCRNRFDLRNLVVASGTLTRIGVIVLLFNIFTPQLWHAGVGALALAIVVFAGAVAVWRYLTPSLRVAPGAFSPTMFRRLWGMGGWVAVNQVGTILFLNVELFIVNRLYGPEQSGHYALALQWSTMLRLMAAAVAAAFAPTVLSLYARRSADDVVAYVRRSIKILGLFVALPVGLVCGLSRPLLEVWLGAEFVFLAPLLSLMTIHLGVNLSFLPVHSVSVATNRVRVPGIASVVLGTGNLALALALALVAGWGVYGVAAAGAIMLIIKNTLFTPIYNAWLLDRPRTTFLHSLIPTTGAVLLSTAAAYLLSLAFELTSWWRLLAAAALLAALFAMLSWRLWLTDEERHLVRTRFRWPGR